MRSRIIGVVLLCALLLTAALAPVQASPNRACKPNEGVRGCQSDLQYEANGCTVSFFGTIGSVVARTIGHEGMAKRGGPFTFFINILVDGVLYDSVQFELPTYGGSFPSGVPITYIFDEIITGDISAVVSDKPDDIYFFAGVDLPDELGQGCSAPLVDCPYPLPAGSVQARVLFSTPAYYAPSFDAQMNPPMIMPVGESWWVIGAQDGFYHLFITCRARYVWVPAEALGANFDIVWNGRALPDAGTPPAP